VVKKGGVQNEEIARFFSPQSISLPSSVFIIKSRVLEVFLLCLFALSPLPSPLHMKDTLPDCSSIVDIIVRSTLIIITLQNPRSVPRQTDSQRNFHHPYVSIDWIKFSFNLSYNYVLYSFLLYFTSTLTR
jgi:hypothetical protein